MLILKRDHVGLIFIDDEDADGLDIVDELEKDMFSIEEEELTIVQIDDPEFAEELGLRYMAIFTTFDVFSLMFCQLGWEK